MIILIQITAVVFMFTLMFVGIWGFILMNQIYGQMRYKNYLLEKLTQNVYMIAGKREMDSSESAKN